MAHNTPGVAPGNVRVRSNQVTRFTLKVGDGECVIGANPHWNDRNGVDIVALHEALQASARAQNKEEPSPLAMLDGFGAMVNKAMHSSFKRKKWSAEQRQAILEAFGCKCAYCKAPLDLKEAQFDHRDALANGGVDEPDVETIDRDGAVGVRTCEQLAAPTWPLARA